MITGRHAGGWLERRRTARATARIPAEQMEWHRDHAAERGLDNLRDHYDALLEDRARREARHGRAATRSWNLAIVTLALCLAAFLASVAATSYGWHAVAAGRAAGISALALIGCGFWLHRAALRFGPLEPEPDDEEAGAP